MQLDRVGAGCGAGVDLAVVGIEKQAHDDAGVLEPADGVGHFSARADDIQPALGRHLFAALGHERGLVRRRVAGDLQHVVRAGQLQIDRHGHRLHQHAQIALLNMAAILAQVDRDRVGPAQFGQRRRPNRVGLVRFAGLAHRGHVIDIDAENGQSRFP